MAGWRGWFVELLYTCSEGIVRGTRWHGECTKQEERGEYIHDPARGQGMLMPKMHTALRFQETHTQQNDQEIKK